MSDVEVVGWYKIFIEKTTLLADVNVLDGELFPRLSRPSASSEATTTTRFSMGGREYQCTVAHKLKGAVAGVDRVCICITTNALPVSGGDLLHAYPNDSAARIGVQSGYAAMAMANGRKFKVYALFSNAHPLAHLGPHSRHARDGRGGGRPLVWKV